MKIAIIGNGKFFDFKQRLKDYNLIIAADGGANHCLVLGIKPDIIIGDFDSISKTAKSFFSRVEKIQVNNENNTDIEKALNYLKEKYGQKNISAIDLFCVNGNNRPDHGLYNICLLGEYNLPIKIIGDNFTVEIVSEKKELRGMIGKIVSLLPLACKVDGLETKGFKWNLDGNENFQYSISNIIMNNEAIIKIKKGKMILFLINQV